LRQESQRFNKRLALLICCIVGFVAVVIWPVIWITNIRAASSEEKTLAEIKAHLIARGRNITETEGVLRTYYCFILDQINKVARERGEKLSYSAIRKISLEYIDMWIEATEAKLGLGFLSALNHRMEIYRAEGLQALLQFLREGQALEQMQQPATQNLPPNKEQLSLFGGGNGDSFETAVIVNADNSFVGVEAEYAYIANQCGQPSKDWKLESQGLREHGGKPYDVLTIALSGGATRTFYFDIAEFFTP
jgi:hypothetical protein